MEGSHFRRQVPIGPYIADFACMATRIVIEVDGSQHGEVAGLTRDNVRTRWLEAEGYKVIRFWNSDVSGSPHAVMDALYSAIYGSPSADTLPLKHERTVRKKERVHPTPARLARRPSPSRGG
jgi:very-short-patch-repair endonuclease